MRPAFVVAILGGLIALTPSTAPTLNAFRFNREIAYPAASREDTSLNACAILDANVFAHAGAGLADLRLFDPSGQVEIPFAITLSSTLANSDPARITHIAQTATRQLTVDLQMPRRPYSQLDLSLNARNYAATAHVTGLKSLDDAHPVFLGDITLFDLTSQNLGSSTAIPVAESTFPYLRVRITFQPTPGNAALLITPSTIASVSVPPARQAQTLYTGIAQSFAFAQRGPQTVIDFSVPARVPIERISLDLEPAEQSNFSRSVNITATTSQFAPVETITGQISQVQLVIGSQKIQQHSLSIPAVLGSNAQTPAKIEVAVQNGTQPPLKIRSARLEMRQRQLCFPAAGSMTTLAYGSESMQPPAYDFARTFDAAAPVRRATLLHEHPNTFFVAPVDPPSRFKRNQAFLGLAAFLAVCLLAVIGYRAIHRRHRDSLRR